MCSSVDNWPHGLPQRNRYKNSVIAACLQMMLLTGARPGEVLALRWEDVNTQWKGISIRDKVEGTLHGATTGTAAGSP